MPKDRSGCSVIQSALDIKAWLQNPPTVEQVRPARCVRCGAASSRVGYPLQLYGHGTRERQVRGPSAPDKPAVLVLIMARRYRCVVCGAVPIVVPREVLARRAYSASAIGLALALWGLLLLSAREVRRRCSPATILGDAAATGWATLRRWTRAVARGALFPWAAPIPTDTTLRQVAASAAAALVARAAPTTRALPPAHRAFFGAARAA
jgi:hypothetical protein